MDVKSEQKIVTVNFTAYKHNYKSDDNYNRNKLPLPFDDSTTRTTYGRINKHATTTQ